MNIGLALANVANSDAHMLWMIGLAATSFPGNKAAHLRAALSQRTTTTMVVRRPGYYIASFLKGQILRQCGLVVHCPSITPGGQIALCRLAAAKHWPQANRPIMAK